jgi:hypothetical protein
VYVDDVPEIGDSVLELPQALSIPVAATTATLTFWHLYDFEYNNNGTYDGGVLEVSQDGRKTWSDAGSNITLGGYTGTIFTGFDNPLSGRAAWVFTSPAGWGQVSVDLMPYRGTALHFRWRMGSDSSNELPPGGWWVDDVQVDYEAPPAACDRGWSTVQRPTVSAPCRASRGRQS